jgi:hypothetical protein
MRYIMVPASATTKIGDRKARPLARVVRPEHQQVTFVLIFDLVAGASRRRAIITAKR